MTVASPSNTTAQISFTAEGVRAQSDEPVVTIEVADVDAVHSVAVARGCEIVRSLRDEELGRPPVLRADPDGRVVNVMSQPGLKR